MTYTQTKLLRSKKLLTYGKNKNMYTFQNKTPTFFYLSRQFSLSPPIFGNSIATILFFFSSHFRQLHCHKTFVLLLWAATILFFFPSIFSPNVLLFSNFSNLVATNFFPLIYGNFIAKITIKFPPLQFQQLGCHNFFFPPIFSNLVATIPFFLFPHSPTILATQLPRLVFSLSSTCPLGTSFGQQILCSNNFGNLITEIQNFFLTPTITSFISHLSYFLLEFRQRCYRNLLLSSSSQITSNCTHITNKLNFLQYSAKRLEFRSLVIILSSVNDCESI